MIVKQVLLSTWLVLFCVYPCQANDWNLWRGPNCNGSVAAPGYFGDQPFGLKVLWNHSVGSGYSGVSIVDQRVLTMFNEGKSDYLGSFDVASGKEIWRYRIGRIYKAHDGGHDGPVSTPVADDSFVFALGPRGRLFAVQSGTGEEVWSVSLAKKYGSRAPFWGFATTPVLYGDVVIVQANGVNGHGLIAFDKRTGEYVWHRDAGHAEYRSPVLANIDGKHQVIACGPNETVSVDPESGRVLWRYAGGIANDQSPVYLGERKILLSRGGSQVIELNDRQSGARQLWRSREFAGNYDVPAHHDGYLYGFTNRYLTCVDAATGKRVWRSRPPGGKGLIIVDGHLIVFGDRGDVVVAEASPRGYIEKSRANVSDGAAYSWPAFASETIVVRNLKHLVALKPTASVEKLAGRNQPDSIFAQFVKDVEASSEKSSMLDRFMNEQTSFPLVENDKLVHFVYRGKARDVGVRGTMLDNGEEDPMIRIDGTDCFYRTYEIEPGANWEYQFVVDFDRTIPDPRNSRRTFHNNKLSEVVTSGWSEPDFVKLYQGNARGRTERFQFRSSEQSFSTAVDVYLPHDYRGGSGHPLVIVLDGQTWVSSGRMPNTLDHLLESRSEKPIVAFVHRARSAELGGWRTSACAKALHNEILPAISKRYRVDSSKPCVLFGRRGGAVVAVYTALRYPAKFSDCVAISYGRADTVRADMINELIQSADGERPRFHIAWNRYEARRPQSFDCRDQSRQLTDALLQNGFSVTGGEDKTGFGWGSWRVQAGNAINAVFEQ